MNGSGNDRFTVDASIRIWGELRVSGDRDL